MSMPPVKTATPKPRAAFAAAAFGNLRAAAGEGQGEALRILLADIDEDASQPRTVFEDDDLQRMAETIRAHGVVQPIVVRPPVRGRYALVFGARRLRASRLAGVADIPAVVRAAGTSDLATQIIENQQRAGLCNSDLAAAIDRLVTQGLTNKEIAAVCALKDYQVAAFRQVNSFPPELAERLDHADVRALYDLFRQWKKTPASLLKGLPDAQTFITVTEARRIIGDITGKPTGSIVLDRIGSGAGLDGESRHVLEPHDASGSSSTQASTRKGSTFPPPKAKDLLVFIVAADDRRTGRLVVDRKAQRKGRALVAYAKGVEEVDAAGLRIVRIE
jgi:ParB family chromosome partitioning protein